MSQRVALALFVRGCRLADGSIPPLPAPPNGHAHECPRLANYQCLLHETPHRLLPGRLLPHGVEDSGHTVCALMTDEFLSFARTREMIW